MRVLAVLALLVVTSTGLLPAVEAATAETWTDGIYDVESGMPQGALAADATVQSLPLIRIPFLATVVGTVATDDDPPPPPAGCRTRPARAPPVR